MRVPSGTADFFAIPEKSLTRCEALARQLVHEQTPGLAYPAICSAWISRSNTCSCPSGFTFSYTLRITPPGSTTNVVRSQNFVPFHSDCLNPSAFISPESVSASRPIVKANLVQKFLCEDASSALTPTNSIPAASKSPFVALNDFP